MPTFRKLPMPWTTIFADTNSSDGEFNPCTPWLPAVEIQAVRMTFEVRNTTDSSGVVKPALQTANVENSPDAAVVLPAANPTRNDLTGDGMSYPNGVSDISSSTVGKQLVRFGVYFDPSTDASLKLARFGGLLEWVTDG